MDNLEWVTKKHPQTHKGNSADVVIWAVQCDTAKNGIATEVAFRNSCQYKITNNGFVVFAKENDRIYFKGSNEVEGFRLTYMNTFKVYADLRKFVGDYSLLFDESMSLYYIDSNQREN